MWYFVVFEFALALGGPDAATVAGPMTHAQCDEYAAASATRPVPPGYRFEAACIERPVTLPGDPVQPWRLDGELAINGCVLGYAIPTANAFRYRCRPRF